MSNSSTSNPLGRQQCRRPGGIVSSCHSIFFSFQPPATSTADGRMPARSRRGRVPTLGRQQCRRPGVIASPTNHSWLRFQHSAASSADGRDRTSPTASAAVELFQPSAASSADGRLRRIETRRLQEVVPTLGRQQCRRPDEDKSWTVDYQLSFQPSAASSADGRRACSVRSRSNHTFQPSAASSADGRRYRPGGVGSSDPRVPTLGRQQCRRPARRTITTWCAAIRSNPRPPAVPTAGRRLVERRRLVEVPTLGRQQCRRPGRSPVART